MPDTHKKPCGECPFRRKSAAGWLGAASPEQFIQATLADAPMPCHTTVDYEDPHWKEQWLTAVEAQIMGKRNPHPEMKHCAGGVTFFANICKMSREPGRPTLPKDKENVFDHPGKFVEHHRSFGKGSWEEE